MSLSRFTSLILAAALSLAAFATCVAQSAPETTAAGQQQTQQQLQPQTVKPLSVRLRSFIVGASGTLSFEPTTTGGVVRLTALGLPQLRALLPGAQGYFIWAVAPGVRPMRVGELLIDGYGNGGLEFMRPEPLERYSVLVTAEMSYAPKKPAGMVLLSTWLGEARAFFGSRDKSQDNARNGRMMREIRKRTRLQSAEPNFFNEVDDALNLSLGGGRTLEMFGEGIAPDAYGVARVTALNSRAYVRAILTRLPPPEVVGANTYVLWGIRPDGRISYMGSLPTEELNDKDIYVRVAGFASDRFNLFVTAERLRPAANPNPEMRALASRSPEAPTN